LLDTKFIPALFDAAAITSGATKNENTVSTLESAPVRDTVVIATRVSAAGKPNTLSSASRMTPSDAPSSGNGAVNTMSSLTTGERTATGVGESDGVGEGDKYAAPDDGDDDDVGDAVGVVRRLGDVDG
jgi:hypothetical protein